MGIMDLVGGIADLLQKPQSIVTGGVMGGLRQLGLDSSWDSGAQADYAADKDWVKKLQAEGYDTSALERRLFSGLKGVGDLGSGLKEGATGHLRPSDVVMNAAEQSGQDADDLGVPGKVFNTGIDLGLDPLIIAGVLGKGAAAAGNLGRAGKLADTALSAGKLGEEATKAERLSAAALRTLRRTYQGTVATGDPLSGFAAGQILGLGENQAAKYLPQVFGKIARDADRVADDLPSAVQTRGAGLARQGEQMAGPSAGVRGQGSFPDVDGPIEGQLPIRGELGGRTVLDLDSGPVPTGELMPATARVGDVGARPMGPIPEFADVSVPQQSFMDQLVEDAVRQMTPPTTPDLIGRAVGTPSSAVRGPSNINEVLIDPTLQGSAREDYVLNALEQILRNNR